MTPQNQTSFKIVPTCKSHYNLLQAVCLTLITVIIESEKCQQCNKKISSKFVQEGWNIFHKKCYKQFKTQNTGETCFKCGEKTLEWVMFQVSGLNYVGKIIAYHLVQSFADTLLRTHIHIRRNSDHDKAKPCTKTVSHALFVKGGSRVNI